MSPKLHDLFATDLHDATLNESASLIEKGYSIRKAFYGAVDYAKFRSNGYSKNQIKEALYNSLMDSGIANEFPEFKFVTIPWYQMIWWKIENRAPVLKNPLALVGIWIFIVLFVHILFHNNETYSILINDEYIMRNASSQQYSLYIHSIPMANRAYYVNNSRMNYFGSINANAINFIYAAYWLPALAYIIYITNKESKKRE